MARLFFIVLYSLIVHVHSFVAFPTKDQMYGRPLKEAASDDASTPSSAKDLFGSDGWKSIQADLDKVPIFTCANELGQPMAYSIETKGESYTVPFFYCDVGDAEAELKKSKEALDLEEGKMGIIPFPMGKAFELWANDKAVIVPNKEAVLQAGAPPNTNPIGQQVPLFACMDIMQPNEDGTGGVLPLFLTLEEANAAVEQAVEMDGGKMDDFEVVSLSLTRAIELLATVSETPAFQFVPPQKSVDYIQNYLSLE